MAGLGSNESLSDSQVSSGSLSGGGRAKRKRVSMGGGGRPRIPSIEDIMGKEEPKWTVYSGSQNLAAALNDPVCREYDLFTKTWGSYFVPSASFPSSTLPDIQLADFLRYLKETAAGRKSHRAIMRQLKKESQDPDSPMSPVGIRPLVAQLQQDGRTYDLSTIPRVFMQADFSLEDPPTFQEVIPVTQLLPVGGRKRGTTRQDTRQTSKLLHEKLTHYLDIIEVHLAYQISQRSDLFFSTLSSQQELQTHIMQVRHEVMELRHRLRETDSRLTHPSLQVLRLHSLRSRYLVIHNKLSLIATVQQTQPTIQLLLGTSDFVAALELISTTQEVLQQELQGVHSVRHLSSQLTEMEKVIEKMMEAEFVGFALKDIQCRLLQARGSGLGAGTNSPSFSVTALDWSETEERLVSVVCGLLRQGKLHFLTALRESLLAFLKNQVKETLKAYLEISVPEVEEWVETPSLADRMRAMEFEGWLGLLEYVFNALLQHLATIESSVRVISRVCERAAGKAPSKPQTLHETSHDFPTLSPSDKASSRFEPDFMTADRSSASDLGHAIAPEAEQKDHFRNAMQSFEASAAVQEAEDRLEQLFLEDELSDARLGGALEFGLDGVGNFTGELEDGTTGHTRKGSLKEELNPSRVRLEQLSRRESRTAVAAPSPSEGGVMSVGSEGLKGTIGTTVDPGERQRLEDSLAIAGFEDTAVISPADCNRLLVECQEVVSAACDLVHSRCAKILSIRAKAGLLENVLSSDFVALVRLIERFVNNSAHVTGRHCPNLRSALLTQAKKFLEHFHDTRRAKLSLLLDGERWKQADVPTEIQSLVHRLEAGIAPQSGDGLRTPTPDGQTSQPPSKYLNIHGHSFAVVGVVLLLVKILLEYCQCADDLPMLINELMSKLIETLKFFNVRTCQLVLGAGAMQAVGLKTITARHLALVSRCLQAVMLLLANIRRHFQLRLAPKQHILLTQFDQVAEDFTSHCRELNKKVMNIMDELIQKHISKWEAKSPIPSPCFKTLIKQIVKLHENLVDITPQDQLEALLKGIEHILVTRLRMQLVKLGITNNGSTQHGIVNSELTHFKGALSTLENINDFGSALFDVWIVNR